VKITAVLCDAARAEHGKLYIIGAGITWLTGRIQFALAFIVEVPWEAADKPHKMKLELIDPDGGPALAPTEDGTRQPLVIDGEIHPMRPEQVPVGTPIAHSFAMEFNDVPLPPGPYEWRFWIDGETKADWRIGFRVLDAPPQQDARAA
jgi:hypothetical protein